MQDLVLYPPEGYKFTVPGNWKERLFKFLARYDISYTLQAFLGNLIPLSLLKSQLDSFKSPSKESILTYSLSHLILRKEPWILDMANELPYILASRERQLLKFKDKIKRVLASKYCKRIICRVEKGREAFLAAFGREFADKVEVVYWASPPKKFKKQYNREKVKILFVNSGNINTALHFYSKGGAEVVEAFLNLSGKYKDNIELVLRSGMSKREKEKYSRLKNIKIIDKPIPWAELEREWKSADIFVLPNHANTPAQVFLDAMSYGLPIVTTDTWANSEIVEDGKTGFLIHNPRAARFTDGPIFYLDNPQYVKEVMKGAEPDVVKGLVEKLSILIEKPDLRKAMGEAGKREIESGKHSIKRRNEKLKRILDEATA